jgi:hypothetical protein
MNVDQDGFRFRIPASRRLTWDLLYFHRDIPLCGHDRRMNLRDVSEARSRCATRISWPAVFLKAYALAAVEIPELRQIWYRWPWAHLYQHPQSVGVLTVQRYRAGVPWLFWGKIGCPETLALRDIQSLINRYTEEPTERIFSRQLQLASTPTVLRRLIWWFNINVATGARAKRLGTFFLSTLSSRGVEIQVPPSIHTGCLTFGPLDDQQSCRVTLAYDHRIMDGVRAAEVLNRIEQIMNVTLTAELQQESGSSADARRAA